MFGVVAFGLSNREFAIFCLRRMEALTQQELTNRLARLSANIAEIPDFYMEFSFEFSSWVPLVGRFLPKDTCRMWKRGSCIRLDCSLGPFRGMKWRRGNLSFMFFGDGTASGYAAPCSWPSLFFASV